MGIDEVGIDKVGIDEMGKFSLIQPKLHVMRIYHYTIV